MGMLDLIEQGKIKRYFRIKNKINFPGAVCHITQRAPGKELLFLEDADYLFMLKLLKDKTKEYKIDVFAFCLMPNHIHILLKLKEANLQRAAKDIFAKYAMYFNKKYQRKGHVFSGAYREALCCDDSYLIACSLYIHLNPARAGIVSEPTDYRWSTCSLYLATTLKESFVNKQFVLGILDKDIKKAKEIYRELLFKSLNFKTSKVWENRLALDSFRSKILKPMAELIGIKPKGKSSWDLMGDEELESKIQKLKKKKRLKTPKGIAARKYIIEQLRARGYNISEIAQKLGVSRSTIHDTLHYSP